MQSMVLDICIEYSYQVVSVEKVWAHPYYSAADQAGDIALVRLGAPLEVGGDMVQPIQLAGPGQQWLGQQCIEAGWSKVGKEGNGPVWLIGVNSWRAKPSCSSPSRCCSRPRPAGTAAAAARLAGRPSVPGRRAAARPPCARATRWAVVSMCSGHAGFNCSFIIVLSSYPTQSVSRRPM